MPLWSTLPVSVQARRCARVRRRRTPLDEDPSILLRLARLRAPPLQRDARPAVAGRLPARRAHAAAAGRRGQAPGPGAGSRVGEADLADALEPAYRAFAGSQPRCCGRHAQSASAFTAFANPHAAADGAPSERLLGNATPPEARDRRGRHLRDRRGARPRGRPSRRASERCPPGRRPATADVVLLFTVARDDLARNDERGAGRSSPTACSGSPGRSGPRRYRPTSPRTSSAPSRSPSASSTEVAAIDATWSGLRLVWRRDCATRR